MIIASINGHNLRDSKFENLCVMLYEQLLYYRKADIGLWITIIIIKSFLGKIFWAGKLFMNSQNIGLHIIWYAFTEYMLCIFLKSIIVLTIGKVIVSRENYKHFFSWKKSWAFKSHLYQSEMRKKNKNHFFVAVDE